MTAWSEIRTTVFSWSPKRNSLFTPSSAKKLTLNQAPVITVTGKAPFDVGHSLKDQRSKPAKPSSRLRSLGDSSGHENSSQRLREAPFCFGIFLPATRSRIARRNFSRSAGLSASSLKVHRFRDGFSVSNALLLSQSLPAFIGHNLDKIGEGTVSKEAICSSLFRCSR